MKKFNFLERSVAVFAPATAVKMMNSRTRGFDGAKKGRRLGNWGSSIKSPNHDISNDRDTLISRSRDLEQNDCFAKGAIDAIVANVVGEGIIPSPYIFNETAETPEHYKKKMDAFDALIEDWADTTRCDQSDMTNLYGNQGLIMRTIAQSGMCFIIREKDPENRALPIRLKILEPDYLDVNKNSETTDTVIFRGIEVSKKNWRVVAYWILDEHPDGGIRQSGRDTSTRIPIKDVLAPFMKLRPGQLLGIPWSYAALTRMHDFSKYEDAQLVKQQVSALVVSYIQKPENADLPEDEEDNYYETREPGGHIYLNPGETVVEANPPNIDGFKEFSESALRGIARAFGITYEELTQDYSNVNFSSARMGFTSMNRNIKVWRAHMLNPMFLDKLSDWMIEAGQIKLGDLSFIRIKWTPPRREMIDPSKEISSNAVALQTGQTNLTEIYAESGRDFKKAMRERKAEIEFLESLGLKIEGVNLNINISNSEDEDADTKAGSGKKKSA
nr:phage portal protein [Bdellovibrio sp. CKG001]